MLTDSQIIERIKNPLNKEIITKCQNLEKDLKRYMDGLGYKNPITENFVDDWESDAKKDLRKHLEQAPTIPIAKLIRDELNKGIKTTTAIEKINPEKENFQKALNHTWKDGDVDFMINSFLKKSIDTDFCSFLVVTKGKLIEIEGKKYEYRDGTIKENDGEFLPYTIYVSIEDVHDFKSSGVDTLYLIYNFGEEVIEGKKHKIFRYIDHERDLLVKETNSDYEVIQESILYHEVGYTPAKQISDLYLISSIIPEIKSSQMSHVVGEFASYEVEYKDLKISEVRHAFPKYYSIALKCPICDGHKQIINPNSDPQQSTLYMFHDSNRDVGESIRCPYCKGEGALVSLNSKEAIKLPAKIGDQQFNLSGAPAGFIQFPRESLEYQRKSLSDDKSDLIYNATGSKNIVITRLQTATEVDTNTRSLEMRIEDRQRMIESNINFIGNTTAKLMKIQNIEYEYKFQRNISYKSTETLYEEIEKAVSANMPESYINELKNELVQIRFNQENTIDEIQNEIKNKVKNGDETKETNQRRFESVSDS